MKLLLVTPEGTQMLQVAWLELNTVVGNMIIRPHHAPLIALLAAHKPLHYGLLDGSIKTIMPFQGIAEINRESATIIMNAPV